MLTCQLLYFDQNNYSLVEILLTHLKNYNTDGYLSQLLTVVLWDVPYIEATIGRKITKSDTEEIAVSDYRAMEIQYDYIVEIVYENANLEVALDALPLLGI